MKITFEDKSYIEVSKSTEPNNIIITIQAKDYNNPAKKIINSVEISNKQWQDLISNLK